MIQKLLEKEYNLFEYCHIKLKVESINSVYLVFKDDSKYILKIYDGYVSEHVMQSIDIQEYIAGYGLAPRIIKKSHGGCLCNIGVNKYAFLQQYLESENSSDKSKEIAKALSKLHGLMSNYSKPVLHFRQKKKESNDSYVDLDLTNYMKYLYDLRETFHVEDQRRVCTKHLLHNDIRPQNIVLHESGVKFIDFDYFGFGNKNVEILKSAILCSNFDHQKVEDFLKYYFGNQLSKTQNSSLRRMLLVEIIRSDFPYSYKNVLSKKYILDIINERKKIIDFLLGGFDD